MTKRNVRTAVYLCIMLTFSLVIPSPCSSVSQCPGKNVRPPQTRAFNKPVDVAFNRSGDDNCGLGDGWLVKATALRVDFRTVITAC